MIQLSLPSLNIINYNFYPSLRNINNIHHKILSYLSLYFENDTFFNISLKNNSNDSIALSYHKSNSIYSIYMNEEKFDENKQQNIYYIKIENEEKDLLFFKEKILKSPLISLSSDISLENIGKICDLLNNIQYNGIIISESSFLETYKGCIKFLNSFIIDLSLSNTIIVKDDINLIDTIYYCNKLNKQGNFNLYFSYYKDKNNIRQEELNRCLELNLSNPLFKKIIIINENNDTTFIKNIIDRYNLSIKIIVIDIECRYKFKDFFIISNLITKQNDLNILINSDIILGKGLSSLKLDENKMLCLSRYDITSDNQLSVNVGGGSHDCWVWKGKITENIGNFYMGKYLCDGVLANQLYNKGYILKNPINGIFCYHYHISNIRNYSYSSHDIIHGQRKGVRFTNNDNIFSNNDIYNDGCN